MNEADMAYLHRLEDALDALYNSHRFRRTLSYLFDECALSPYELFGAFGAVIPAHGTPLASYTDAFFDFACTLPNVDRHRLRDLMLWDRLASVPDHALPKRLYLYDARLAAVKKALQARFAECECAERIGIGILYTTGEALAVAYTQKHPITGEYPSYTMPLP